MGDCCEQISFLENISSLELLNQDPRPTFILDLESDTGCNAVLEFAFLNTALKVQSSVLETLRGQPCNDLDDARRGLSYGEFRSWSMRLDGDFNPANTNSVSFGGLYWDQYTLRNRWRVVSSISSKFTEVLARDGDNEKYHIESQAESEGISRELQYAQYSKNAPVGILLCGTDGRILYANDVWLELTQIKGEHIGLCCNTDWFALLVHPDHLNTVKGMWHRVLVDKVPVTFEMRLKRETSIGRPMWLLLSAYSRLNPDDTVETVVISVTDVSNQKFAEEVQKKKVEDAMEVRRQQQNFIDVTSHEIRNPLMVVLQCSEEIGSMMKALEPDTQGGMITVPKKLIEDTIDGIETIEYCTMHQKHIIDDILTLSRADAGLLPLNPDKCQPLLVVKDTLKVFEREMNSYEIEFKFRIDDSFLLENLDCVELDAGRLSQMLINLISNAIKFTKGRPKRVITVSLCAFGVEAAPSNPWALHYLPQINPREDNCYGKDWIAENAVFLHLNVQDTGRGLAKDEKKNLFERFCQASSDTHVQYGGSGLGLYICRTLAEMQGGRIGFNSEAGEGSVFGFYIKAKRCTTLDEEKHFPRPVPYRHPSSSYRNLKAPSVTVKQITEDRADTPILDIMLVEDNLINQKVLRRQLESLGHRVIIANHGKQALEILQKTTFWKGNGDSGYRLNVILMDVEMPVMNGRVCVEHIRKLQNDGLICSHVPVIAVTGNARPEHVEQAKASGMVCSPQSV
jgi:PAS domain S-box-containing protein